MTKEIDSLDPLDWKEFRAQAHEVLDEALDYLSTPLERDWRPIPDAIKADLDEPLPIEPQALGEICGQIRESLLPYPNGNMHPRFFGWVHGAGTPSGIIASIYEACMNNNLGGREHAAVYIERQLINWCKELIGFTKTSSGMIVSGTSMGNIIGLNVARQNLKKFSIQLMTIYTSEEAHLSVKKAALLLGFKAENVRKVHTDTKQRIDLLALRDSLLSDRNSSLLPCAIVGTAGTAATGAIDDLEQLAEICRQHDIWFHVDAAFGAALCLSPQLCHLLKGIEKADSVAFDFHKWMHVNYEAGCVLVKDQMLHREAFDAKADYFETNGQGAAAGEPWFSNYGPELSRGFRALKPWLALKHSGSRRLGHVVEKSCRFAKQLEQHILNDEHFELLVPVSLNIVCFRSVDLSLNEAERERHNRRLLEELQHRRLAVPSSLMRSGRVFLRVCIMNHRLQHKDIDEFFRDVQKVRSDLLSF